MRARWGWAALVATVGAAFFAGNVLATPPAGLTDDAVRPERARSGQPDGARDASGGLDARIRTHGLSDMLVADNTLAPGGTTGWHTHPGPSVIVVVSGTVTNYGGQRPELHAHVYTAGQAFTDPAGKSVHMLVNDGTVDARTMAMQILPRGATGGSTSPSRSPVTCQTAAASSRARRASGLAQVGLAHLLVAAQRSAASSASTIAAGLEHVAAVGHAQRHQRVLLDQQDRACPGSLISVTIVEDLLDQDRRQAHRRLVEQQQPRPGHQRPADRQHLLLAARQRAGLLRRALA